jgi:hypothetical protein
MDLLLLLYWFFGPFVAYWVLRCAIRDALCDHDRRSGRVDA